MSDSERSPLLPAAGSSKIPELQVNDESLETAPLLGNSGGTPRYDGERDDVRNETASIASRETDAASIKSVKGKSIRWPSVIAMIVLSFFALAIMVLAFFVPAAMEEYAKQAVVVEPTNLSLVSITTNGVRARIQANFRLDAQRVENIHVRRVGRAATWLVGQLATEETKINIYLPDYDNVLLGTAAVPGLTVSIEDGRNNEVDIEADLIPGEAEGIRMITNEWLEGRLGTVRVKGTADIEIKAGVIPLGKHSIAESMTFEAHKLPQMPEYNITRLNFVEQPIPGGDDRKAMAADVSIQAFNQYPVSLNIPPLGFEILLPGCGPADTIHVAAARTSPVAVHSHSEVVVQARGIIEELSDSLIQACPNSDSSPLDLFFEKYLGNETTTVLVRGKRQPDSDTPDWLGEILSSITVSVPFPGRSFDNLIRSFSLTDVHFTLPDPMAEPGDPDANPKVSGTVIVLARLPSEMNFSLDVKAVRANANVFYRNRKLGELILDKWQTANSTQIPADEDHEAGLEIQSRIEDAPLNVTDPDVLSDVIQALLFGGKTITLDVDALVDVKVQTILGELVLKSVPADGTIPLKPLGGDLIGSTEPKVGTIEILDTTSDSISLNALVNITNPTPYSAYIPFISIHIENNGSTLGEAHARDLNIQQGENINLLVSAKWQPAMGGRKAIKRGRDVLSEYISGFNTTITIRTYNGSFPSQPSLGKALSRMNLTIAAPKLHLPGKDKDEQSHFLREATFHLFSSTATFTLVSPLEKNVLYIDSVDATALYNHTEPIGRIEYDLPFAAPPGESVTPRLPVDWSRDSIGYDKVWQALGGKMKLDAKAVVGVRLGKWTEKLWYVGKGIGASIRL
ncbi:hypothetical protein QBC43DRAFT_206527 [Cladorrhinum sp. PSN259]|nr:hypothetical protein QBC43DRAFT_206527 [Cladorrhinum sp. PSN259]